MPGEFDFIEWLRTQQTKSDLVQLPAGDDLAILKWDPSDLLLVGTDQVLDGVHFDSKIHSPRAIGKKVMNRNLSDCAAMACLPAAALATVALPKGTSLDYVKELYLGLKEAADVFECQLIGGDTATWPNPLALTVTIIGRSAGIQPIRRSSAKPGDLIYVTGKLGGSSLGRHMTFEPRVALARDLALGRKTAAMIDISDGLSRDIRHICHESAVGAIIEANCVPIHDDAIVLSLRDGCSPLDHALHDGEDHELLYTARGIDRHGIYIGRIASGSAIQLQTKDGLIPLEPKGWEHKL